MRIRSGWVVPAALIAGMALPLTTAHAASRAPSTTSAPSRAGAGSRAVLLPTGDVVDLTGPADTPKPVVFPAAAQGVGRALITRRLGGHTYVMPMVAEPYLGRVLDPSLFDVTRLSAMDGETSRIPVRMSYQGNAPAVPGVTVTSARNGTATGYLDRASAKTFGQALTEQYQADLHAGRPRRTTLFTGVTGLRAEVAPLSTPVTPKYQMVTLNLRALGVDGKADPFATLILLNADDQRRYGAFVYPDENGEAKVSVPKGHYTLLGDDGGTAGATENSYEIRLAFEVAYAVTTANQTLSADFRKATIAATATAPKVSTLQFHSVGYGWQDQAGNRPFVAAYDLDPNGTTLLPATPAATVGSLTTVLTWQSVQPGADPTYSYDLATSSDHIPAKTTYAFTTAQIATLESSYYGDGGPLSYAGLQRFPNYPGVDAAVGGLEKVTRGRRLTEYVGATGTPTWSDLVVFNYNAMDGTGPQFDDYGLVFGEPRPLPAGTTRTVNWFRGPLTAGIPTQSVSDAECYYCRSGNQVVVGLTAFTDSDPSHAGYVSSANNGLPTSRFRVYRDGTLISDEDDVTGATFTAPAAKTGYKIITDVDRRNQGAAQSTRTSTVQTFTSAKDTGKKLPAAWACDAGPGCRVLPLLTARLALPTDLQGQLPGKTAVTLTLAQAQAATTSTITSATLEYRPAGYYGRHPVPLKAIGGGRYQGVIDASQYPGVKIDLFLTGTDRAGSTIAQTIANAYTVKES